MPAAKPAKKITAKVTTNFLVIFIYPLITSFLIIIADLMFGIRVGDICPTRARKTVITVTLTQG
jgi:hypothetical protein